MTAEDLVNQFRILVSTPSGSSSRWSDTQCLLLADRSVKALVSRIRFPESRISMTATSDQQEYPLPELYRVKRVYLNGQIIVEVEGGISTLEGRQILLDDQSAQGFPVTGSGAPVGAGGAMQPQWTTQTPVSYPFLNSWGSPAPQAQPWTPGERPRYYLRGGSIGFVPAPGTASINISIDCVRVPTTLTDLSDNIVLPDNFQDACVWKMCDFAKFADDDDRSAQQQATAAARYEQEIRILRTWKRMYGLEDERIFQFTERKYFRYGNRRVGSL